MKKILIILITSCLGLACKKNNSGGCPEPALNCTGINCLLYNYIFDFRITDKNTGTDLVFGSNPRYTTSDVKLYNDAAQSSEIPLTIDNTAGVFKTQLAAQEMYLVVAGTDIYKLDATFKAVDCCSSKIKDLTMGTTNICTCCGDVIAIPVF